MQSLYATAIGMARAWVVRRNATLSPLCWSGVGRSLLRCTATSRAVVGSSMTIISGRSVIAMAMTLRPEMIVMDEPTTALDVVVQRQILQEIADLQKELKFAVLFITHDLSMLIEFAHSIGVMYAGELVEMAKSEQLFRDPKHPYTVGLMSSFPPLEGPRRVMHGIPGAPPNLSNPPPGCRFYPRCRYHDPSKPALFHRQMEVKPRLSEVGPGHWVACHLYESDLEGEGVNGLSTAIEGRNPELPVLQEEEVVHAG